MNEHNAAETHRKKGAKCTLCEEWVDEGGEMALITPVVVGEDGTLDSEAKCIHGALCMDCYRSI